jgi:formylglycine-generating enzyme required for sulfatase activity
VTAAVRWVISLVLLAACDCSTSHTIDAGAPDAGSGFDASDGRIDAAGGVELPDVDVRGPSCASVEAAAGRVCIERGWFWLPMWSPLHGLGLGELEAHERAPAYLDTFILDATEVTNEEFLRFAEETGSATPYCGLAVEAIGCPTCDDGPAHFQMDDESPWPGDGTLEPGRERDSVHCVSAAEAEALCAWRGGRLPTYHEWFKAFVGPWPAMPRYPWGDADEVEWGVVMEYVELYEGLPAPPIGAVGRFPAGASAFGVLDLSGGVSELVAGCRDALEPDVAPVVRPRVDAACVGQLVAGSNWISASNCRLHAAEAAATGGLFTYAETGNARYAGGVDHLLSGYVLGSAVGVVEGRNWRIGFRCAYDP